MTVETNIIHASTVAVEGRGVLIVGPSGSGKSSLAVQMIALGATLVADDRTILRRDGDKIIASVPSAIAGMIEARGVGLIAVPHAGSTPLHLVVDLSQFEPKRLPEDHSHSLLGVTLPCLHKSDNTHFASAILLYIKAKQRF